MTKWICHPGDNRMTKLVPVFRRRFEVHKTLEKALLQLTAHGVYEAEINGRNLTENRFMPGLTSFYYRVQVQEYDVTAFLQKGENELRVTVGDGWWRWNNNFGYTLALWGKLKLCYTDGSEETVATDECFEVTTDGIVRTDLQKGEVYDARIRLHGWQKAALCTEHTEGALIENQSVPVREKERFSGKPMRDAAGKLVIDFGQNLAGYVHMTLRNTTRGQTIYLKHGEGLDKDGCFSTVNCDGGRAEFQEITYICAGREAGEYTPHFAVFGFRYALVEGVEPENAVFEAIAVYSDMEETGNFKCSVPLINQLVENACWSQKGNFLDVPVDCPTRERNTWTGDAMIYCRTAAYFMNVRQFFKKWMVDQTIEQYASGKLGITFPSTSSVHNPEELLLVQAKDPAMALAGPSGDGNIGEDSVGWGDSAVWIPYQIYATGFSNGGALSGALVSTYPDLLAGISAMGWMIPVRDRSATELKIPFLLIQGTQEFTQPTFSGAMAVMEDEKEALRDFFARNDLFHAEQAPDYDATPYWGYPADRVVKEHPVYRDMFSSCVHKGDVEWTISQYFHPDYRYPLAELILVENAGHVQHSCNARYAWDFFKHFARTEDGRIIELAE